MTRSSPRVAPDRSPAERPHTPLVFAHRGGRGPAVPRTRCAGFDLGIAPGADGLELDVHLSRRRRGCRPSRSGPRPLYRRDRTARGANCGRTVTSGCRVSFRRGRGLSVARAWRGGADVECCPRALPDRPAHHRDQDLVSKGAASCRRSDRSAGAIGRVCIGSFNFDTLQAVRRIEPALATSASRTEGQRALYRSWCGLGVGRVPYRAFQVPEQSGRLRVVSPRFIKAAHRANLAFQVWTVNEEADMRRLLNWGVDGLISDRPDEAVRVRDDWMQALTRERRTRTENVERRTEDGTLNGERGMQNVFVRRSPFDVLRLQLQ